MLTQTVNVVLNNLQKKKKNNDMNLIVYKTQGIN